jgi:hypothetical protein
VEGKGPVPYLLDMKCSDRGKYYRKSDIAFENGKLLLQCNKRGAEGNVNIKRPLRFHLGVIEKLQDAVKFNQGLRKSFASAFCEALSFKKDRELSMEMYLRIATSSIETLEAGLFPLTAAEAKAKNEASESREDEDVEENEENEEKK